MPETVETVRIRLVRVIEEGREAYAELAERFAALLAERDHWQNTAIAANKRFRAAEARVKALEEAIPGVAVIRTTLKVLRDWLPEPKNLAGTGSQEFDRAIVHARELHADALAALAALAALDGTAE